MGISSEGQANAVSQAGRAEDSTGMEDSEAVHRVEVPAAAVEAVDSGGRTIVMEFMNRAHFIKREKRTIDA
jgi:hypothetical protein